MTVKKSKEKTTDEMKKEFFSEEEVKVSLSSKIINIILWTLLLAWIVICLVDFYKVKKEEEPLFCIKKDTIKYEDGNVYSCLGPGYKVYNYKRDSFSGMEYGPFWLKDRSK